MLYQNQAVHPTISEANQGKKGRGKVGAEAVASEGRKSSFCAAGEILVLTQKEETNGAGPVVEAK